MARESIKKDKKEEEKKVKKTTKKASATVKSKKEPSATKKATTKKTASKKTSEKKSTSKKEEIIEKKTPVKKEKTASKKTSTPKKATIKKEVATSSKSKKDTASKKASSTKKETTTKKVKTTKKAATEKKEPTSKKTKVAKKEATSKAKKTTSKSTSKKSSSTVKQMLPEYYDLPYRYNETVVKILAQTPTTLFVYWDISDNDRNALLNIHGENMFYETRPILIVHNKTKNYSFEIEINDFANSWYIRTQEPDCNYVIELGRRVINRPEEYIYINSSNNMTSPNNHILFEKTDLGNVLFRNVKTNVLSSKDFGSLRFINDIDKLYGNVYDVYSRLYKDETLNELTMPSSGEFMNR